MVKKIADEHGARVRIGNLSGSPSGNIDAPADGKAGGAQVSLSFSNLAAAPSADPTQPAPAQAH